MIEHRPSLEDQEIRMSAGESLYQTLCDLFPLCRSITGDGLRQTLRYLQQKIPLVCHEVPSGTRVFDWQIPPEWKIRSARLEELSGKCVVDFSDNNLHVLNYSTAADLIVSRDELEDHLASLPDRPDAIPYRTSYYERKWGLCLQHRIRKQLVQNQYRVFIDAEHDPCGSLTYGELILPGSSPDEILFTSHVCHPSLANDNLSSVAIAVELARWLAKQPRRFTYRFLFAPGTIGALTWLSQNPLAVHRNRGGLVLALLGDSNPVTYKRSRAGRAWIDDVVEYSLEHSGHAFRVLDYQPFGYDERQFNSPGIGMAMGRLSRAVEGGYDEYHTSDDSPEIVLPDQLAASLESLKRICEHLEADYRLRSRVSKGEPQLGKRGLYPVPGASENHELQNALQWSLGLADGQTSLLGVAHQSGIDIGTVEQAGEILHKHRLVQRELSVSTKKSGSGHCRHGHPSRESQERSRRAHQLIPGGAHTYAKGDDQFPTNAPRFFERGQGCYAYDTDGNRFIEYGMGLRAVALGHAFPRVIEAAQRQLECGANFTRPASIELEAAEELLRLLPAADMVKFTKNGSDATTAAIRLARASTGRGKVLVCRDQPFFSVDDWFIGTTPMNAGIPDVRGEILGFPYGDLAALQNLLEQHSGDVACVIMEAANYVEPPTGYLHAVRNACREAGALFVLDEMITGFRWNVGGAQAEYGLEPDLSTFGKALGNGLSVAALAGKREHMRLGGLQHSGDRVFLLSYTHGAETHSLAAARATIRTYLEEPVIETMHRQGQKLRDGITEAALDCGVSEYFGLLGRGCNLIFYTKNAQGERCQGMRTLLLQELIRRGVFAPSLVVSYAHADHDVQQTIEAFAGSLKIYAQALESGWEKLLDGRPSKPVFRRQN
jgi:glutamate-1-semialdehyde 2,1-aminomutase